MKGKNFSCNNLGQRKKSDFYETPYSIASQLLDRKVLDEPILEPACGNRAIVKTLKKYGYQEITYYDIDTGTDFLDEETHYPTIITNPPFSLAQEFIEHALPICDDLYLLLPLSYLHGKKRYDSLYNKKLLYEIFVFTRYPMLGDPLRQDGKYRTGMMVYAWFHFTENNKANADPVIHWLDNNEYILNKNDK